MSGDASARANVMASPYQLAVSVSFKHVMLGYSVGELWTAMSVSVDTRAAVRELHVEAKGRGAGEAECGTHTAVCNDPSRGVQWSGVPGRVGTYHRQVSAHHVSDICSRISSRICVILCLTTLNR